MAESKDAGKASTSATGGACAVCGEPGVACSACNSVHYCGRAHQQQHWPQHRALCKAYVVRSARTPGTPNVTRHLAATRPIAKGAVIFTEDPIVILPIEPRNIVSEGLMFSCPGCCYISGMRLGWQPCRLCGTPLCSSTCEPSPLHRPECEAMRAADFKFRLGRSDIPWQLLFEAIVVFRCLTVQGAKAVRLRKLGEERASSESSIMKAKVMHDVVEKVFGKGRFTVQDVEVAVVVRTHHTVDFSYLGAPVRVRSQLLRSPTYCASPVYYESSLVGHSCQPNVEQVPIGSRDSCRFKMALRARVDIQTDEQLCICRTDMLMPTYRRIPQLTELGIRCSCERCNDPTEMGLYLGSICCDWCKGRGEISLLLPLSPRSADTCWKCNKCNRVDPPSAVSEYNAEVSTMSNKVRNYPDEREQFLETLLFPAGRLHPTHSQILFETLCIATALYGRVPGFMLQEMTADKLERKLALCRKTLTAMDKYDPGFSLRRGNILFEMVTTLTRLIEISDSPNKVDNREAWLKEAEESLSVAELILSIDPDKLDGLKSAKTKLDQLRQATAV